mmetsp:Transcript_43303/g.94044  ORF Transcript_43303/g.94044 Transcript_43303/m.94044 type:complete len:440 (+) Transcript_43303:120-1439(+)
MVVVSLEGFSHRRAQRKRRRHVAARVPRHVLLPFRLHLDLERLGDRRGWDHMADASPHGGEHVTAPRCHHRRLRNAHRAPAGLKPRDEVEHHAVDERGVLCPDNAEASVTPVGGKAGADGVAATRLLRAPESPTSENGARGCIEFGGNCSRLEVGDEVVQSFADEDLGFPQPVRHLVADEGHAHHRGVVSVDACSTFEKNSLALLRTAVSVNCDSFHNPVLECDVSARGMRPDTDERRIRRPSSTRTSVQELLSHLRRNLVLRYTNAHGLKTLLNCLNSVCAGFGHVRELLFRLDKAEVFDEIGVIFQSCLQKFFKLLKFGHRDYAKALLTPNLSGGEAFLLDRGGRGRDRIFHVEVHEGLHGVGQCHGVINLKVTCDEKGFHFVRRDHHSLPRVAVGLEAGEPVDVFPELANKNMKSLFLHFFTHNPSSFLILPRKEL